MTSKEKRFFVTLLTIMAVAILSGSVLISLKTRNENREAGRTAASSENRDTDSQASSSDTAPSVTENTPESQSSSETVPSSADTQPEDTTPQTAETSPPTESATVQPEPTETQQASVSPVPPGPSQGKAVPALSWITEAYLEPNEYSRPQIPLTQVNNIVIHWVANPGSTAEGNREYFENLKTNEKIKVSSHYIIGPEGEILSIIPTNEVAYCNYPRNNDTVSIENCHPDWDGKFNDKTYGALIRLSAYLCEQYGLPADALIRHHDVSGKDCPKYYVEHPEAWEQLKEDVRAYMQAHPDIINEMP